MLKLFLDENLKTCQKSKKRMLLLIVGFYKLQQGFWQRYVHDIILTDKKQILINKKQVQRLKNKR